MHTDGQADLVQSRPKTLSHGYFQAPVVWTNVFGFLLLHLLAFYSLYPVFTTATGWKTFIWMFVIGYFGNAGITIGAHRLFTHRAFTASTGLKIIMLVLQTIAGQNCVYVWVRDHRQHHKYSETDADPHNSNRGFFFSHIGWLMMRKHPEVIAKGKNIDMSDLEADPHIMFQKKYYTALYFLLAFFMPVIVPCLFWAEGLWNSILISYWLRYALSLNTAWTVNSIAHLWGTRPYNKNIQPYENKFVGYLTNGEGWHNYHHQFPWDYRAAELGMKFNMSTHYINMFAKLGMATNLRSASTDVIRRTIEKHGDGSHNLWGYGDRDMYPELQKSLAGDGEQCSDDFTTTNHITSKHKNTHLNDNHTTICSSLDESQVKDDKTENVEEIYPEQRQSVTLYFKDGSKTLHIKTPVLKKRDPSFQQEVPVIYHYKDGSSTMHFRSTKANVGF